jgi:hypothetical protein
MLHTFAIASIGIALPCSLVIVADVVRRPQKMGVMNVVWPVTALYFSVFALWAYVAFGRAQQSSMQLDEGRDSEPTPSQVAKGTAHCGAGCMIADVLCEFGIGAVGITLLGSVLWAEFAIDLAAAWLFGIVFQYFALRPMRKGSTGRILIDAVKADTLSILAFQVGMYTWMALTYFVLFPAPHLKPMQPEYWLLMQVGMVIGFATSYPMNGWLIRHGLKEAM